MGLSNASISTIEVGEGGAYPMDATESPKLSIALEVPMLERFPDGPRMREFVSIRGAPTARPGAASQFIDCKAGARRPEGRHGHSTFPPRKAPSPEVD